MCTRRVRIGDTSRRYGVSLRARGAVLDGSRNVPAGWPRGLRMRMLRCSQQLALDEFPRRFFVHVLPLSFVRLRHFGFFAHRRRAALLSLCFALLGQTSDPPTVSDSTPTDAPRPLWLCPECGGAMAIRTVHRRRGALPLSSDRPPEATMTCSFSSRNFLSREHNAVVPNRLTSSRSIENAPAF
jgi:hypothetical protein